MTILHDSEFAPAVEPALSGELSVRPPAGGTAKKARKAKRLPVEFNARLNQQGAAVVSVHILDLSTHGFRVDTHLDLSLGKPVWLRLPGLEPALAYVIWTDGYLVGCAFDRPLHPTILDLVVSRSGAS